MNIFILNTGRCGSTTFIKACQYIDNYSAAHESRIHYTGVERLNYSKQHIEADNRLSWILGRLDRVYGNNAFYVHLKRDIEKTTASFVKRSNFGIMKAYREGVLMLDDNSLSQQKIAADYLLTVEANINCFLKDKTSTMTISLKNIDHDFQLFWERIHAGGDLKSALKTLHTRYNVS